MREGCASPDYDFYAATGIKIEIWAGTKNLVFCNNARNLS